MRARHVAIGLGLTFLVLALLVLAEWAPLMEADADAVATGTDLARNHHTYRDAMKIATFLLNSGPILAYTSLIGIWLAFRGRSATSIWFTSVVALGILLNPVLKLVFDRERPTVDVPVESFDGLSFPSGHAASSALLCSALALVFWRRPDHSTRAVLIFAVFAIPLLTGWTRITLGGHYPSDVVGGALWAVAWVAAWQPALPKLERALSERALRRR